MSDVAENLRLGFEAVGKKRFEEARGYLGKVLAEDGKNLDAVTGMAFMAATEKKWKEAAAGYAEAAGLMPTDANLWTSAGEATVMVGEYDEAIGLLRKALEIAPGDRRAMRNLGKAQCFGHCAVEAIGTFEEIIRREGRGAENLAWLAQCLGNAGRADEAVELVREALGKDPKNLTMASVLALMLTYASKFSAREAFEAHRQYGELLRQLTANLKRPERRVRPEGVRPAKVRVGWISPDLRGHAMGFLTVGIAEHLDRERYELVCYYSGTKEDQYTARYEKASVVFRRVWGVHGEEIARMIAEDGVHVLIDPAGHTANTRISVMALKPAPVQMTYLGYPNTTGIKAIDWRIVDALTDPPGSESLSVERLARVEGCFLSFEPVAGALPEPGPLPADANGSVTFACFGSLQKYNDGMIGMWVKVLEAVPGSRLLLKHAGFKTEATRKQVAERFVRAGLKDVSRVVMEPPAKGAEEMLPLYQRVDISLDTFPYNGTTTICETYTMGVPIVTRAGDRSVSRVGLSLNTAMGLTELVAKSEEEYVKIAAGLAGDLGRLREMRRTLRGTFQRTIGDVAGFTRRFERVIEEAFVEWNGERQAADTRG